MYCSDQTIPGKTDQLVVVPCNTSCLIAYSINTFLKGFYGVDFPICQSVGCAILDEDGNIINDAKERLGIAAAGEITTYTCWNETFQNVPGALQAKIGDGNPCNWYNPEGMVGKVDQNLQSCTKLEPLGEDYNNESWFLVHIKIVIGAGAGIILFMLLACCACWWRKVKRSGKQIFYLSEGKRLSEVVGLYILAFVTILLLAFMNAMQPFLLREIYEADVEVFGRITAKLTLADEVWSLFWLGGWGIFSDLYGLKLVVQCGLVMISISLFLFPHAGSIFPGLLIVRLLFAQGGAALSSMLTVFLAELFQPRSLGLGSGFLGIASGCGALCAVFILVGPTAKTLCVRNTYYIAGSIPLCFLLLTLIPSFQLLPPKYRGKEIVDYIPGDFRSLIQIRIAQGWDLGKKSLLAAKESSRLAVAYIAGYCARAGSVVVTSFISLWVVKFLSERKDCEVSSSISESTCGEDLLNPDKRDCASGFTLSSRISGTVQTVALFFALIAGITAGRSKDPLRGVVVCAGFGVVAYGVSPVFEDPTSSNVYILAFLWGIAEISMIIFAQVLVSSEMAQRFPEIKGAVGGMYSMFGSIGIITLTYVGGYLFDVWIPLAPFILLSGFSFIVFVAATAVLYVAGSSKNIAPGSHIQSDLL